MQLTLLKGQVPECKICKALLDKKGFNEDELSGYVHNALQELNGPEKATAEVHDEQPGEELEKEKECQGQQGDEKEAPGSQKEDIQVDVLGPFEYVERFRPHIELLEPGTLGRKLPYRCNLCKTGGYPNGKIGDFCTPRAMIGWVDRHCKTHLHQKMLARFEAAKENAGLPPEPAEKFVDCQGIFLDDKMTAGHLYEIRREFDIWATYANIKRFARHSYVKDQNRDTWCIHAQKCKKTCEPTLSGEPICRECLSLGKAKAVWRTVLKFAWKYWPARWLTAKLFHSEEAHAELEQEIRQSGSFIADPVRMEQLMTMPLWQLQQVVRSSWECVPDDWATDASRDFVQICIKPALRINVQTVPKNLAHVAAAFSAAIASGRANEAESANLRIALGCLDGRMDDHPFLQGVALQCLRMVERERRGIESRAGRRGNETCFESELVRDAGLSMAINAGNKRLAQKLLGGIFYFI